MTKTFEEVALNQCTKDDHCDHKLKWKQKRPCGRTTEMQCYECCQCKRRTPWRSDW